MKIIAVDDDFISLNVLSDLLQGDRYHDVTLISSALDALRTLRNEEVPFDCILLDIEMPELSGIDLCREIRCLEAYRSSPILMLTRLRDQSSIKQAFANGATDYIKKPFDGFEVLTRINVAERLVQERQAAIDSYAGIRGVLGYTPPALSAQRLKINDLSFKSEAVQLRLEGLLPLPAFRNYLEQVAETDGCDTRLFAMGIRNIERVFARMYAADFLKFLESFASALKSEFGTEDTFLSHVGNGAFLCATSWEDGFTPEEAQMSIFMRLKDHYPRRWDLALVPDDIVSGRPIRLNKAHKLNFKRAVKAALARLDLRAIDTRDLNLSKLAG